MKKLFHTGWFVALFVICITLALCACGKGGKDGSKEQAADNGTVLQGDYMVSDGEYLYYTAPDASYDYAEYFGVKDFKADEAGDARYVHRIPVSLEGEPEVISQYEAQYLSLGDGMLFYTLLDGSGIRGIDLKTKADNVLTYAPTGGPLDSKIMRSAYHGSDLYYTQEGWENGTFENFYKTPVKKVRSDGSSAGDSGNETDTDAAAEEKDAASEETETDESVETLQISYEGELVFDCRAYVKKHGDIGKNADQESWSADTVCPAKKGLFLMLWTYGKGDREADYRHCLLYLPYGAKSEEAQMICEDVGDYIYISKNEVWYLATTEDKNEYGDLYCTLAHVAEGGEPELTDTKIDTDKFFGSAGKLYYTRHVAEKEQNEADDFIDRLLTSYDTASGKTEDLSFEFQNPELMGAGGNVLWVEDFNEHTFTKPDGSKKLAMTKEPDTDFSNASADEETEEADDGTWESDYGPGMSSLVLSADSDKKACFRLMRGDGSEEFMVLLDEGESVTKSFPCGTYVLRVAEGTEWISDEEAFGESGHYSTTERYNFESGGSYRISSGTRGDFYGSSASGFTN